MVLIDLDILPKTIPFNAVVNGLSWNDLGRSRTSIGGSMFPFKLPGVTID
jgi:hypothetical protein